MIKTEKRDISILDCIDRKSDMTTSLYIYELEDRTINNKIEWAKEWNGKSHCYKYYATYVNQVGMKVKLELLGDRMNGIELEAYYHNHGKMIKHLFLTEFDYQNELEDLLEVAEMYCRGYGNYEKYTNPYYNRSKNIDKYYSTESYTPTVTKVRNSRGLKADRLLKDVEFSYNCQILGDKSCIVD